MLVDTFVSPPAARIIERTYSPPGISHLPLHIPRVSISSHGFGWDKWKESKSGVIGPAHAPVARDLAGASRTVLIRHVSNTKSPRRSPFPLYWGLTRSMPSWLSRLCNDLSSRQPAGLELPFNRRLYYLRTAVYANIGLVARKLNGAESGEKCEIRTSQESARRKKRSCRACAAAIPTRYSVYCKTLETKYRNCTSDLNSVHA